MSDKPCLGGPPLCFRVEPFIEAAQILVQCDEPLRALELLNNLPGYFRDHPPVQAAELRQAIQARLMMPADYITDKHEKPCAPEQALQAVHGLTRGKMVLELVRQHNAIGLRPHIIEIGPADYWLTQGLKAAGVDFSCFAYTLASADDNNAGKVLAEHWLEQPPVEAPVIFCACEVIEHLSEPKEILTFLARCPFPPAHVIVSTPCYTYDEHPNWREEGLPHLRTYTPRELMQWLQGNLPAYQWECAIDALINVQGRLR